jgi:hypothetical protein
MKGKKKCIKMFMYVFENGQYWQDCVSVCTDGVASVMEKLKFSKRICGS